jgi:RNA polymerase sigma-70 factor (ECF subfamily)
MTGTSDARLVARVRTGDREAAEVLAQRYLPASRAIALGLLGHVADAEDVSQEAFLIALRDLGQCRDPARFGAWLAQIVRNRARDLLRARTARTTVSIDEVTLPQEASQLESAARGETRSTLLKALDELDEVQREAILLHDMEGWKHREIAALMGLPAGTVRSHVFYARARMREILRKTPLGEDR